MREKESGSYAYAQFPTHYSRQVDTAQQGMGERMKEAMPTRATRALIDLSAIEHNVKSFLKRVGSETQVMAVVKADGYGHGALPVGRRALEAGATWLAVAIPEEGETLRRGGILAPILVLGPIQADKPVAWDLVQTVADLELAQALNQRAGVAGKRLKVHLEVDTGMGRTGVRPEEALELAVAVARLPHLELEGVFTHFASADEVDKSFSLKQIEVFRRVTDQLRDAGFHLLRHMANSAGLLDLPDSHLDLVRPGISLYGLYPSREVSRSVELKPAMTLMTRIAFLKEVPKGFSVSYGCTFYTRRRSCLATLPIGYADGLDRHLSNSGEALVHGVRVSIVGRVCMDMCVVDVTDVPGVRVGDQVVIFGRQGEAELNVDEVAKKLGTINYEVVCRVGKRVPRIYIN